MKPSLNFLLFFIAIFIGVISCKKDAVENPNNNSNLIPKFREAGEWIYQYYNSDLELISSDDIDTNIEYHLIVETINDSVVKVVYFESEEDAYQFTVSTGQYVDLKNKIEAVRAIRDFATQYSVDFNSDNEPPQAVLDFIDQYNTGNKTTGVGLLREHVTCPSSLFGSSYFMSGNPQWTLGNFRNKASGAQGGGLANMVWDNRWFGGRGVYLLLGTGNAIPLVKQCGIDFNDRAESCW